MLWSARLPSLYSSPSSGVIPKKTPVGLLLTPGLYSSSSSSSSYLDATLREVSQMIIDIAQACKGFSWVSQGSWPFSHLDFRRNYMYKIVHGFEPTTLQL